MSAVLILERLLDDEGISSKEHMLETASPKLSNVEERLNSTFDALVNEISTAWGGPQFNSRVEIDSSVPDVQTSEGEGEEAEGAKKKLGAVVPSWSNGTARSGGTPKTLRLSYWKRPDCLSYVVLRTELDDSKKRPLHYDIVLGSRRRNPEASKAVGKLRQTEEHWFQKLLSFLQGR